MEKVASTVDRGNVNKIVPSLSANSAHDRMPVAGEPTSLHPQKPANGAAPTVSPSSVTSRPASGSTYHNSRQPAPQATERNLDFISTERSADEYAQAVRHSGKVKLWRVLLPIIAVLIMLGIVLALVADSLFAPDVSIDSVSLQDGNLVMENPRLNGFDKNKRPFSLTADRAVQDASNPTRVTLNQISATLPMDDAGSATIQAGNGIYDAELKTLVLEGTIRLETNTGARLELDDADIDIGEGKMNTSGGIAVTSPQADISADSVFVEDQGNRIVFTGNVRMTVRPDEMKKATEKE